MSRKVKMDDAPDFLDIKGVKGNRCNTARFYSSGWKLRVEYEFDLTALHEVGGARYYDLLKNDFFTYEEFRDIGQRYVKPRWMSIKSKQSEVET